MSRRPLVFVLGLTVGDYLLWNWSLNGSHDVVALVSGLTLPPLVLASLWLIAVGVARLLALIAQRPARRARTGSTSRRSASGRAASPSQGSVAMEESAVPKATPGSSGRIAA